MCSDHHYWHIGVHWIHQHVFNINGTKHNLIRHYGIIFIRHYYFAACPHKSESLTYLGHCILEKSPFRVSWMWWKCESSFNNKEDFWMVSKDRRFTWKLHYEEHIFQTAQQQFDCKSSERLTFLLLSVLLSIDCWAVCGNSLYVTSSL